MPSRSRRSASACLSGNRGSKRYTTMLVSTRLATLVEFLSTPAAICVLRLERRLAISTSLAFSRSIKQGQSRLRVAFWCVGLTCEANRVRERGPYDFVAGLEAKLFRERFGYCDLQLARYFGHVRTVYHGNYPYSIKDANVEQVCHDTSIQSSSHEANRRGISVSERLRRAVRNAILGTYLIGKKPKLVAKAGGGEVKFQVVFSAGLRPTIRS